MLRMIACSNAACMIAGHVGGMLETLHRDELRVGGGHNRSSISPRVARDGDMTAPHTHTSQLAGYFVLRSVQRNIDMNLNRTELRFKVREVSANRHFWS